MMEQRRFSLLIVGLLTLSLICLLLPTATATPAIGSTIVTIYSVADAYVNSASPDTNYGGEEYLYVGSNSEFNYTYVMFNLSSIPSDANIISAQLSLFLSSTGGEIYWLPADTIGVYYCSDSSWTESGVTWTNKPSFNPIATDAWSFTIIYYVNRYKSWNVTEDVRAALTSGNLTEVLKFKTKTEYGYAVFHSREGTNKPKLEVEYATEPVCIVHLESIQDTGVTANLGLITLADNVFSLPTDVDVVADSYEVSYGSGYTFVRWETSGGVSVSNTWDSTTTVTVSGEGTLRAVGNAKRVEYAYDYETPQWESNTAGRVDAVRFTPLFSGQLLMARFYIYDILSFQSNTFKVHVMDENRYDIITPFNQTPTSEGWFDVDLSVYGLSISEGVDFYIGMEWIVDYNPDLGQDKTSPSERSWHWNGTAWSEETYSDFMVRAVVGTLISHAVVAEGITFHVTTESNSTITKFEFIQADKKLIFNVTGTSDTTGFCNVTIPNQLLGGPFIVRFDNQSKTDVFTAENSTHTSLYFTYNQSEHKVEIIGTTVIPEFPAFAFPLLLIVATLAAIIFGKRFKTSLRKDKNTLQSLNLRLAHLFS